MNVDNYIFFLKHNFFKLYDYFALGGIIMVPLCIVSLLIWLFIIERFLFYKNEKYNVYELYYNHQKIKKESLLHNLVEYVKKNVKNLKNTSSDLDYLIIEAETIIDKNLSYISILTVISPLLGLLGTVSGLVFAFDILNMSNELMNSKGIAYGISESLITTEVGLIIAIPGYVFYNFLKRISDKIKYQLNSLNYILKIEKND
jgi:biopolymer transport protein ExbB